MTDERPLTHASVQLKLQMSEMVSFGEAKAKVLLKNASEDRHSDVFHGLLVGLKRT